MWPNCEAGLTVSDVTLIVGAAGTIIGAIVGGVVTIIKTVGTTIKDIRGEVRAIAVKQDAVKDALDTATGATP
jgi:hypothetical protein